MRGREHYFHLFCTRTELGFTQTYEDVPQAHSAFTQGFTTTNSFHEGLYQRAPGFREAAWPSICWFFKVVCHSFFHGLIKQAYQSVMQSYLSLVCFLPGKSLRQRNVKIKWKAQGHIRSPRWKWRSVEAAPWFSTSPSQHPCWGLTSLCFIVFLWGHSLLLGLSLKLGQCIQNQERTLDGVKTW